MTTHLRNSIVFFLFVLWVAPLATADVQSIDFGNNPTRIVALGGHLYVLDGWDSEVLTVPVDDFRSQAVRSLSNESYREPFVGEDISFYALGFDAGADQLFVSVKSTHRAPKVLCYPIRDGEWKGIDNDQGNAAPGVVASGAGAIYTLCTVAGVKPDRRDKVAYGEDSYVIVADADGNVVSSTLLEHDGRKYSPAQSVMPLTDDRIAVGVGEWDQADIPGYILILSKKGSAFVVSQVFPLAAVFDAGDEDIAFAGYPTKLAFDQRGNRLFVCDTSYSMSVAIVDLNKKGAEAVDYFKYGHGIGEEPEGIEFIDDSSCMDILWDGSHRNLLLADAERGRVTVLDMSSKKPNVRCDYTMGEPETHKVLGITKRESGSKSELFVAGCKRVGEHSCGPGRLDRVPISSSGIPENCVER